MARHGTPMWSPNRSRVLVLNNSMLHIVGIPLLLLGCIGIGFVLVYLKEVLLPFVVALFIVYLLRPLVNTLTTPFGKVLQWCIFTAPAASSRVRHRHAVYQRVSTTAAASGADASDADGPPRRPGRAASPPKYPKTIRAAVARVWNGAQDIYSSATRAAAGGHGSQPPGGALQVGGGSGGGPNSTSNRELQPSPPLRTLSATMQQQQQQQQQSLQQPPQLQQQQLQQACTAEDDETGCSCSVPGTQFGCRMTRCPRWFAILVSLCVAASIIAGLVLLTVDAIQTFERHSLGVYKDQASAMARSVQEWFIIIGIHLEADQVMDAIKTYASDGKFVATVHYTITFLMEGIGNALLVTLLVLYLLAEQSRHAPNSLRAKVDAQIQRYVVIKTAISALQGVLAYLILGVILNVRMAHLLGILHFLLNYIPTAGPIMATVLPVPIIVLDPDLSLTAKIAAFAGPTAVHMVVGNLLEPVVFGQNMELHPVTVLLALALWYALWGIPGAILAVPITAVMRIILQAADHPYAAIVICVMEGRLSAASEGLGEALDSAGTSGDGLGVLNGGGGDALGSDGADEASSTITPLNMASSLGPRDAAGSGASCNLDLDVDDLLSQPVQLPPQGKLGPLAASMPHSAAGGGSSLSGDASGGAARGTPASAALGSGAGGSAPAAAATAMNGRTRHHPVLPSSGDAGGAAAESAGGGVGSFANGHAPHAQLHNTAESLV